MRICGSEPATKTRDGTGKVNGAQKTLSAITSNDGPSPQFQAEKITARKKEIMGYGRPKTRSSTSLIKTATATAAKALP